ncbi:MAG: DUF4363 family protein [Clostridia bacterium]
MYRNSILYIIMVVVILALVIIPTSWFDKMLESDVGSFREKINDILAAGENDPELEEKCDLLQADWETHMKHWSFFINHASIEKVDLGICNFLEMVRYRDFQNANIEAKRLDKIFEMTAEQDALTPLNIF